MPLPPPPANEIRSSAARIRFETMTSSVDAFSPASIPSTGIIATDPYSRLAIYVDGE